LLITRSNPDLIKNQVSKNEIKLFLLSQEKLDGFENIRDIDSLLSVVKEFSLNNPDSLIFLDGVHYLLTRFSFKEFINMIYCVIEIVSLQNSIFILYLDPDLLDEKQLAVVRHELQPLPSQRLDDIVIGEELFDMLLYIFTCNKNNSLVSIKSLLKRFSIVYRTASKRVRILEDSGLIVIKKYGKSKALFATEKGNRLLSRRKTV